MEKEIVYKEEVYYIIGKCMEIHNELGHGFREVVYKDALEVILTDDDIEFEREKEYEVRFRNKVLPHKFIADFVIFDAIILEVKGTSAITDDHISQTLNYMKVSGNNVGLIVNFGRGRLEYKRLVL